MEHFKDFDSPFQMVGLLEENTSAESLQRTKEWFEKRRGRFTGSKIKDLMGCGTATARRGWSAPEKLYDFGASAEKYIYNVGKERITGLLSMEISAKQMEWGKENESVLIQQLLDDGVITDFEELGFETFPNYENGGASADGRCMYKGERVGLEIKCCTSWDGHYARMYEPVHEKHNDFWQHQAEMFAMSVDKILYVVAAPMQTKIYDVQIVEASKLHQRVMLERCKIADKAISLWGGEYSYKQCLELACAWHQENVNL